MYTKFKNTLSALTVAIGALALGYGIGEPAPVAQVAPAAIQIDLSAAVADSVAPATSTVAVRRGPGIKRQLAVPFIAIAPLLSRRGA